MQKKRRTLQINLKNDVLSFILKCNNNYAIFAKGKENEFTAGGHSGQMYRQKPS